MTRQLTRIMHIDDEPDIREIVKLALEALGGYTVISCSSGEEALAVLQTDRPDLILLDVMMPAMDGPETLQRIQQDPETRDIPTVYITAKVQEHEIRKLLASGIAGVLEKPFDPECICGQIEDIWRSLDD